MEEPIITNIPLEEEKPKASWVKYGLFTIGILTIPAFYYAWNYYLKPEAKDARALYQAAQVFEDIQNKFASDTYGGQTPQETIDMFVAALEKGDLELAAKYFKRKTNGEEDPAIFENIKKLQADNRIGEVIDDLKKIKLNGEIGSSTAIYDVLDKKGELKYQFVLYHGTKTPVWKIESL